DGIARSVADAGAADSGLHHDGQGESRGPKGLSRRGRPQAGETLSQTNHGARTQYRPPPSPFGETLITTAPVVAGLGRSSTTPIPGAEVPRSREGSVDPARIGFGRGFRGRRSYACGSPTATSLTGASPRLARPAQRPTQTREEDTALHPTGKPYPDESSADVAIQSESAISTAVVKPASGSEANPTTALAPNRPAGA